MSLCKDCVITQLTITDQSKNAIASYSHDRFNKKLRIQAT